MLQNGDRVPSGSNSRPRLVTVGAGEQVMKDCSCITVGSRNRLCVFRSTYHLALASSVFAVDIGARVLESFDVWGVFPFA